MSSNIFITELFKITEENYTNDKEKNALGLTWDAKKKNYSGDKNKNRKNKQIGRMDK